MLGHDPFGERRRADWTRASTAEESADLSGRRTVRGFTEHEQLDRAGLVHMNGRLYDPQLGRFLSPDPFVANPARSQDWNAYSYVSNSPMSYRDPTGFVRAGPGCNSVTVFCAAQDQGGGFTRTAQGFEHRGQVAFTIPYVTVDWGPVYGGWGADNGLPFLAPRFTVRTATFPVPFVFAGFLSVDGEGPADEPMTSSGAVVAGDNQSWQRTRAARQSARRARYERGAGIYVTGHRVLLVGPVHLAIEYREEANEPETLSAFPEGLFDTLKSDPNRPEDRDQGNNFTVGTIRPPDGVAPEEYFRRLQTLDDRYNELAPYDLFPHFDPGAYNSNSYIRGVIEATGGRTTVNFDEYYGGSRPLPFSEDYFRVNPP